MNVLLNTLSVEVLPQIWHIWLLKLTTILYSRTNWISSHSRWFTWFWIPTLRTDTAVEKYSEWPNVWNMIKMFMPNTGSHDAGGGTITFSTCFQIELVKTCWSSTILGLWPGMLSKWFQIYFKPQFYFSLTCMWNAYRKHHRDTI